MSVTLKGSSVARDGLFVEQDSFARTVPDDYSRLSLRAKKKCFSKSYIRPPSSD